MLPPLILLLRSHGASGTTYQMSGTLRVKGSLPLTCLPPLHAPPPQAFIYSSRNLLPPHRILDGRKSRTDRQTLGSVLAIRRGPQVQFILFFRSPFYRNLAPLSHNTFEANLGAEGMRAALLKGIG